MQFVREVQIERTTRKFHWTDYLHVDVQQHLMGIERQQTECESSAQLVSLYAKRFSPGQWSFFGPGSEKNWDSTHEYKPQGEWDRVAEQMMITFVESRHPVFRSIIQRSAHEQWWWKIVNTLLCRWRDG